MRVDLCKQLFSFSFDSELTLVDEPQSVGASGLSAEVWLLATFTTSQIMFSAGSLSEGA